MSIFSIEFMTIYVKARVHSMDWLETNLANYRSCDKEDCQARGDLPYRAIA